MFTPLKWLTNLNAFLSPYGLDAADVRADALAQVRNLSPYDAASSLVSAFRNGLPILDDQAVSPEEYDLDDPDAESAREDLEAELLRRDLLNELRPHFTN